MLMKLFYTGPLVNAEMLVSMRISTWPSLTLSPSRTRISFTIPCSAGCTIFKKLKPFAIFGVKLR